MRLLLALPIVCLTVCALGDEIQTHHFSAAGHPMPAGWPESHIPVILALAEKPVCLQFEGEPAEPPAVQLHRVTSARRVSLDAPNAEATAKGWQWTWTPPKTRGPAQYEVRFDRDPARIVRIESRDPEWLKATLDMLANATWENDGLHAEERAALADHWLQLGKASKSAKAAPASLLMIPKQGDAPRRRVVWDQENPTLVVWRPGPAAGDWEVRAPRWWISPAALATDHGLIRFLSLYAEPPLNP